MDNQSDRLLRSWQKQLTIKPELRLSEPDKNVLLRVMSKLCKPGIVRSGTSM